MGGGILQELNTGVSFKKRSPDIYFLVQKMYYMQFLINSMLMRKFFVFSR